MNNTVTRMSNAGVLYTRKTFEHNLDLEVRCKVIVHNSTYCIVIFDDNTLSKLKDRIPLLEVRNENHIRVKYYGNIFVGIDSKIIEHVNLIGRTIFGIPTLRFEINESKSGTSLVVILEAFLIDDILLTPVEKLASKINSLYLDNQVLHYKNVKNSITCNEMTDVPDVPDVPELSIPTYPVPQTYMPSETPSK